MKAPVEARQCARFGPFDVDLCIGELAADGRRVSLQEQPFQILVLLLERPGRLVTREEIRHRLWPDGTYVDFEHGINTAVKKLRVALKDHPENPRYIETVPRRGYRFIAPVAAVSPAPGVVTLRRYRRRWTLPLAGLLAAVVAGLSIAWLAEHRRRLSLPELRERQLTANSSENAVTAGAISPDGKYLAYGDLMGLHLKLIQTGETVNIPQPEGPAAPNPAAWWPNGWFPDGTRFIAAGIAPGQLPSAWVVPVTGGSPRKLRDDADPWSVSPDGRLIAFGTGAGSFRSREIWLMGPQGEQPRRVVVGSEGDGFFWAAWSPEGRRIAYRRSHRTPAQLECSIESRDLEGGSPTTILSDPRLCVGDINMLWYPGGRFIYTMLEPAPSQYDSNLWEITVDSATGQAVSRPRRLTNWVGVYEDHVGGTRDGKRLAISKMQKEADVYIGELDANGHRLENTRRLTLSDANDYPYHWMPDSKAVLFWSDRNGTWDIFKQPLHQADAEPVVTGSDYKRDPVVSPDGSWILYMSSAFAPVNAISQERFRVGAITPVRILRVPTSGGAPQLVLEGRAIDNLACARSPAGLCVFSEPTLDERQLIFSLFDPIKGRGKELTRINLRRQGYWFIYSWDLSPEGSGLALTEYDERQSRIQILPLTGGEPQEFYVKGRGQFLSLFWAADSKGLFVGAGGYGFSNPELLYVDLLGRARILSEQRRPGGYGTWGIPSPDGRHVALLGFTQQCNVWMLEDF